MIRWLVGNRNDTERGDGEEGGKKKGETNETCSLNVEAVVAK